jgi:predicted Zn-dependent peptidase
MLVVSVTLIAAAAAAGQRAPRVEFKDYTLKNGLRVILAEDRSAPLVGVSVVYKVGSRDERKGRAGFAHLFEHMMFKGSQNVGRGEHFYQIATNGGAANAQTTPDRTVYYNLLPSNQLEMILFLEADRMRGLAITKENFENQRDAVKEERLKYVDNMPYGKSAEVHQAMIYDGFAYGHSTLGPVTDLDGATVEEVSEFFKTYYAPNNAVLTLVGDFDAADALAQIRKYFEPIARRPAPPVADVAEGAQKAERRRQIEDGLAQQRQVDIAFKAAPGNTQDFYALQALARILQAGQSSRLHQRLVRERGLATSVGGMMDEMLGPGAFYITALVRPGKKAEEVESAIYEEVERLTREPVADRELQKAKLALLREFINAIQPAYWRAVMLGVYAASYNDPGLINNRLEKVNAVTSRDLLRVARKYLGRANRSVLVTSPAATESK